MNPILLLSTLAALQTHGWTDADLSYTQLENKLRRGDRIYVACGIVSELGRRLMVRNGYQARLVATVTLQRPFAGDNGHTLLEVRLGGSWRVFDLDLNRQPLDNHGRGMSVEALVRNRHRQYRTLSDDPVVSWNDIPGGAPVRRHFQRIWRNGFERWYDRVLGVPLHFTSELGWFFTTQNAKVKKHIQTFADYRWLPSKHYRKAIR